MGFKRYIIKRVTTLGSLVKSYKEGGSDPEKSNIVVAILDLDKPRKTVDIIYEQELGGDTLLINRG
ncbi:hypothetical protein DRN58_06660 [Thermococci archaeon]|nr:MAG: hypothetical protein DRN58_06660 [Thermococci archaeon]